MKPPFLEQIREGGRCHSIAKMALKNRNRMNGNDTQENKYLFA